MSERKKRKCLPFHEKLALIRKLESGTYSRKDLMREYNISKASFYSILRRKDEIKVKGESFEYEYKKSSKTSFNKSLDEAVLGWFKQEIDSGLSVSGPILQKKALIVNELRNGSEKFKASTGWLMRFRSRYGIRKFGTKPETGEKLSNNPETANRFAEDFQDKIKSENIELENIYSCDESGIYLKTLINVTLALSQETGVAAPNLNKERITALFCSNATGCHRLPLLTIGKYPRPTSLENLLPKDSSDPKLQIIKSLGVTYSVQRSTLMDKQIFMAWYTNSFIPEVLAHQNLKGITGKTILIVDDAPSHPKLAELNSVNPNFEVIGIPSNVSAFIQPMDQGIIGNTKKFYKKNLMRKLLTENESVETLSFINQLNLRDCLLMLNNAWENVKPSTLKEAWKPIFGQEWRHYIDNVDDVETTVSIKCEYDSNEIETVNTSFQHEDYETNQVAVLLAGSNHPLETTRIHLLDWLENDKQELEWEQSLLNANISDFVPINEAEICQPDFGFIRIKDEPEDFEQSNCVIGKREEEVSTAEARDGLLKVESWLKANSKCSEDDLFRITKWKALIEEKLLEG